jgi:hypothetical protein
MKKPNVLVEHALAWLQRTWDQAPPTLRRRWPWFIAGGVVLGFVLVLVLRPEPQEAGQRGGEGDDQTVAQGAAGAEATGNEGTPGPIPSEAPRRHMGADAGAPLSPNIKLTFRTFPPRLASVSWGAKRLGWTDRGKPLVVERPRDSGPLDVIVRAKDYLPVHARAYTFDDAFVDVRITPVDKKDTIYGYQQPLTDAGAPPPSP